MKRNLERFPEDFMFQLRKDEAVALRLQIATSNVGRGVASFSNAYVTHGNVRREPVFASAPALDFRSGTGEGAGRNSCSIHGFRLVLRSSVGYGWRLR